MKDFSIENLIEDIAEEVRENGDFCQDQNQKNAPSNGERETRGRKNQGKTQEHYQEYKESKKEFRRIPQNGFSDEIIERVNGEVVESENLDNFKECYSLTCYGVLDKFLQDNEELAKKSVFLWYKRVLIEIKKNTPKVGADEVEKLSIIWDVLSEFLEYIGLYITYETFQKVTNIYKYQLEDRAKLSPKHADFVKKINIERDNALINELQYTPFTQTNKMFIAKVHGIIEQTAPKQIEVTHNIQNFDNISSYRLIEDETRKDENE